MAGRLFSFAGGGSGAWRIRRQTTIVGDELPRVQRLRVYDGDDPDSSADWILRGITSNERYVERAEKTQLMANEKPLDSPEATYAALIPICKSAAWWALTQDERRAVFEDQSHHIRIGLKHLSVGRRLHHCRDISDAEPFDFLTWFEYAPSYEPAFDDLVAELRATQEWRFVDREIDIRLERNGA
jgi:chlorite dismutase